MGDGPGKLDVVGCFYLWLSLGQICGHTGNLLEPFAPPPGAGLLDAWRLGWQERTRLGVGF